MNTGFSSDELFALSGKLERFFRFGDPVPPGDIRAAARVIRRWAIEKRIMEIEAAAADRVSRP